MRGILADVNIQGLVDDLVQRAQSEVWGNFWDDLKLEYLYFDDVGLLADALDSTIWETCQAEELVLITDNRNQDDPNSLEATIRAKNTTSSFPVITISNIPELHASRDYADRVIDKMIDYLMRIDDLRGTGRLFVP